MKGSESAGAGKRVQDMLGRIASEAAGPAVPQPLTGNKVEAPNANGKITAIIDGRAHPGRAWRECARPALDRLKK
jgi:hypothetical protein